MLQFTVNSKFFLHIAKTESEDKNLANAFSYIGMPKLFCKGCDAFIGAYNCVHGTSFLTRGTHGKAYWP